MLAVMRRLLRPRSRLFRLLLAMALLAWMTLTAGAFAASASMTAMQPVHTTSSQRGEHGVMTTSAPCAEMAHAVAPAASMPHATVPDRPASIGHDGNCPCCDGTGCACASLCGGMTAVARLAQAFDPMRIALPPLGVHAPAVAHAAPLLRPPIV